MTGYIARRLLQVIPTVMLSTVLLFVLLNLMRGDAIDVYFGVSADRTPQAVAALRAQLGLDKPPVVQYLTWLGRLVHGDFGTSWRLQEPVLPLILQHLLISVQLAAAATVISLVFSLIVGIYLASHQGSIVDQVTRLVGLVFLSAPVYWVAIVLIVVLSRLFNWIPPMQYVTFAQDPIQHLEIIGVPAAVWGLLSVPAFSRFVRNAMLDVLHEEYIRTARAKGVVERRVLVVHALRNAAGPLATVAGLSIGAAAGGTVLLEQVFDIPGMGRLWLDAINQRDYPLVLGIGVFISVIFVLVNLVTDLSYAWFDPRIRYQ
jgi:peptide/nickel transport system permease protein